VNEFCKIKVVVCLSAPKARWGWEAACPCVSKEAKPAKIVSLIEKIFCAPLKRKRNFCGLCLPRGERGEPLGGFCARQGADCRSKKVRAAFNNCDHNWLSAFWNAKEGSLRAAGAALRSHFSLYFGIKSKGGRKSKRIFLSSIRRFVVAKLPEQKHILKRTIEMFLLSNFFRLLPTCPPKPRRRREAREQSKF